MTMDKIHDKASKIFNDVRKKKVALGNKVDRNDINSEQQIKGDIISNSCCYCQKVFISPKFLLKHILRRHPEHLISLHRKSLKPGSNNNLNDSNCLFDFLQKEFADIKKELGNVTQNVNKITQDDNDASNLKTPPDPNENCELHKDININVDHSRVNKNDMDDVGSNEYKVVEEKVLDMENNVQCLYNKFEELDKIVKVDMLSTQDIHNLLIIYEEKILKAQEEQLIELRNHLRKDLSTMISKHLHENNIEWISRFSALKEEMQKLDYLVDSVRKQMYSPVHLEAIEKKLENQIFYFLNGASRTKNKALKTRHSRHKNISATKQILQDNERISKMKLMNSVKVFDSKQHTTGTCTTSNDLSDLLAEKMSYFNIAPSTTKIACVEYIEKMKLLNSDKALLEQQYPNFPKVYEEINAYANNRVLSKLHNRKSRKLRFSEPVILSNDVHQNPASHENFQNQTYPQIDNESAEFNVSDIGGGGDCFRNFKEAQSDRYINHLESTPKTEFNPSSSIVNSPNFNIGCVKYSKSDCFSIATQPVTPVEEPFAMAKVVENEGVNEDSNLYVRSIFTPLSKVCPEENLDKLEEEEEDDKNSLESLSSWESEENP